MNVFSPERLRITDRWISRPRDQAFGSLDALFEATRDMADNSSTAVHDVRNIQVKVDHTLSRPESMTALALELPDGRTTAATHWSFGQLCSLIKAPAGHYRQLPAPVGSYGLQYMLNTYQGELVKTYIDGRDNTLRALTSPTYGRVEDFKLVDAIRQIAGNGIGDTSWVAAQLLKGQHPAAFFASDRDMFCFLVDRDHPIEVRNPVTGRSDLFYRGVFFWNSEVGSRSLGIKTFLFRSYCDNRLIFGGDQVEQIVVRHTKGAPQRFLEVAGPALEQYANEGVGGIQQAIANAQNRTLASNDDDAVQFLNDKTSFSRAAALAAIQQHQQEEGYPVRTAWDMAQAITAAAKAIPHQDERVALERQATRFLIAA